MSRSTELRIRPYTHKELAYMYHVSWTTFQRWLRPFEKEIGHKTGHFYNTRQVETIFSKLGIPEIGVYGGEIHDSTATDNA